MKGRNGKTKDTKGVIRRAKWLRGMMGKSGVTQAINAMFAASDEQMLKDESIPADKRRRLFILKRIETWSQADWNAYADATLSHGRNLEPRQAYLEVERAAGREPWPAELAPPSCEFAMSNEPATREPVPVCDHCGRQMTFVRERGEARGVWQCVSQVASQVEGGEG